MAEITRNRRNIINYTTLCSTVLTTIERCIEWLQEKSLIPRNPSCIVCGGSMTLLIRGNNSVFFKCRKRSNRPTPHCNIIHVLRDTFFYRSKFGLQKVVSFMYFFSQNNTSYSYLVRECSSNNTKASKETISDWLSFCREVSIHQTSSIINP